MRRQAHRIEGASRTVGASEVAETAARLEVAATPATDVARFRSLAEALQDAVTRVAAELARLRRGS